MAKIDSRVTRVENDNAEMQEVKCKIANVASNKNVSINYGTDTMVDVLDNIDNGTIPTPSGTLSITSNNTYDVTNYASADVNVVPSLQNKTVTITENGTQTISADAGYDGLNEIEVTTNVSGVNAHDFNDWINVPPYDTTKDQIYILNAVYPECNSEIKFNIISTDTGTVYWGDGTSDNISSGSNDLYHAYNFDDIPADNWSDYSSARLALIKIEGARGSITKFKTLQMPGYATTSTSNDILLLKANTTECEVAFVDGTPGTLKMEVLECIGFKYVSSNVSRGGFPKENYSIRYLNLKIVNSPSQLNYLGTVRKNGVLKIDNGNTLTNCSSLFDSNGNYYRNIFELKIRMSRFSGIAFGYAPLTTVQGLITNDCTDLSALFGGNSSSAPKALKYVSEIDCSSLATSVAPYSKVLKSIRLFNFNPTYSSALTINVSNSVVMTAQDLIDLFNSIAINVNNYSRTITLGTSLQDILSNCYVKDTGNLYTAILPTIDTVVDSNKTYYVYDAKNNQYVETIPDFSSDKFYYELRTATWNKYVICESTDTGAMLALNFVTNIKGYTIA